MNVYHIFIDDNAGGFMIAVALSSFDQARLIGDSFISVSKIETWDGDSVYTRKTLLTVH